MKKHLPFVLLIAALIAVLVSASNLPGEAQQQQQQQQQQRPRAAQNPQYQSAQNEETASAAAVRILGYSASLDAGPRIIHVPQSGAARATANDAADIDDGVTADDTATRQSKRSLAKPRRVAIPAAPTPRRILPPVDAPKRAVLNAPPVTGSLTPIYPTPRWRADDNGTASVQTEPSVIPEPDLPPETETPAPR